MANLKNTSIDGNLTITGNNKVVTITQGNANLSELNANDIDTGYLRSYAKAIPVIIARGTQSVGTVSRFDNIITPYSFSLSRPMRILANATITIRPGGARDDYIYISMEINGARISSINMNNNSASTHIRSQQMFGITDLAAGNYTFTMIMDNIPGSGTRNFGGADGAPAVSWEITAFENV